MTSPDEASRIPPGMRRPPRWKLLAWGIPAWVIVGVVWYFAVTRQPDLLLIGLAIGVVGLGVFAGLIFGWVEHNRRLARRFEARRGGRRGAPDARVEVTHDARGHEVRIADGARDARILSVHLDGDVKVIAPPRPADGA